MTIEFIYQVQNEPVELTISRDRDLVRFRTNGEDPVYTYLATGNFCFDKELIDNAVFDTTPILFMTRAMAGKTIK
jgi:hypothetical protein